MSEPVAIHKNKSLADLPGEEWRDVPGFEGSFQASTFGRVRSLDRVIAHPRLGHQFVRGQIMSQSVALNSNMKTGEPMVDLRVTITMEGLAHYFNTRRVIYLTFVDPHLDYDKDGLYVINVDGNGYNNRPENLAAVTKSEKQLRAVRRDRVMPTLKTADRSGWRKNYSRSRPIEQYDLHGNLVAEFPSVKSASRQTRIEDKAIIQVAKGLYRQWNGFVFRYKEGDSTKSK